MGTLAGYYLAETVDSAMLLRRPARKCTQQQEVRRRASAQPAQTQTETELPLAAQAAIWFRLTQPINLALKSCVRVSECA
mmetsp:Transcript_28/g.101  ORF Transcript_28/g.101 Transcript_28/m.101 type:complete len:80 (+) Transcript_28:436-675(+)